MASLIKKKKKKCDFNKATMQKALGCFFGFVKKRRKKVQRFLKHNLCSEKSDRSTQNHESNSL